MISCTEFIPAYSELFAFIEEKGGEEDVLEFWNFLSDRFLGNLREYVGKIGIRGCWEYWSHSLNEEAADFVMSLDENKGEFIINMRYCPSKGRLLKINHITPYHNYCGHCNILYRRVLEAKGFEYFYDMSGCDQAQCVLTVRTKPSAGKENGHE